MREIKFRGKSVKNCEWLYGYLFPRSLLEDADYLEPLWIASGFENECMAVDTESIGQYTGLHDKNGKEIYEGDIIAYGVTKAVIEWVNIFSAFKCCSCMDKVDPFEWPLNKEYAREGFEVIGNIHENPELLEGRE